jgi:putative oxidoreductase
MFNTDSFKATLAPLLLRIGLGIIFIFHGWDKIFGASHHWGFAWHPDLARHLQAVVAWGEFIGGIALLIGFLTPLAAAGIIVIMAGAIAQVHGKHGFSMKDGGYEYNFALISMCAALILLGSGSLAVDRFLWKRGK